MSFFRGGVTPPLQFCDPERIALRNKTSLQIQGLVLNWFWIIPRLEGKSGIPGGRIDIRVCSVREQSLSYGGVAT